MKMTLNASSFLWRLRQKYWHLKLWQAGYIMYLRFFAPRLYSFLVRPTSNIVVEGYPRSANTYLVEALKLSGVRIENVSHHLHDPCQIVRAVEYSVPIVLVLRSPLDSVVSWRLKAPNLSTNLMLLTYISFHKSVLEYSDKITFFDFEDVTCRTNDVIAVISKLMNKQEDILPVKINPEAVFSAIDDLKRAREGGAKGGEFALSVARPSAAKEAEKDRIRDDVSVVNHQILSQAEDVYKIFKEQIHEFEK